MAKLNEVFGVTSEHVLSYIERSNIDDTFNTILHEDNKHIVVYGASKQGKTALVSRYLPYEQNIVVRLSPNTNVEDIYSSILRQCGVEIETGSLDESTAELSATLGIKAKATLWLFGEGEASASGSAKSTVKDQKTKKTIPFNLSLAQDVAELLKKVRFNQKIILENFHYLNEDKQRQLAFDLRSFQELGIIFIILGVWRQKDKLRIYCPDLTDRIFDIPVEPWIRTDFDRVAEKGARELGIKITTAVIEKCVDNSFGSIGVFQELIKLTCDAAQVSETVSDNREINDISFANSAIIAKAEQYYATHQQALELIASGNITHSKEKEKAPLHLPYYLVCAILDFGYTGFLHGINRAVIMDKIKENHHRRDDVRASDMSNLLHNLSTMQHKKGINPPLIDYDITKRLLNAIDSTFFFFLKNCDLQTVKEEIPSPIDSDS